jgi:hypothetical protein
MDELIKAVYRGVVDAQQDVGAFGMEAAGKRSRVKVSWTVHLWPRVLPARLAPAAMLHTQTMQRLSQGS